MSEAHEAEHGERHEALLAELFEGRLDPASGEARALLESCPVCRERFGARRELLAALGRAGALEREVLAELERGAPAPGEEHVAEWVARAARRDRPRRAKRRAAWQLAAAAAVLALGFFVLRALEPRRARVDVPLGVRTGDGVLIEPIGEVAGFDRFDWELDLPLGGYYLVTVVPLGPGGEALPESASGKLTSSQWIPPEDQRTGWTRIRWSVASYPRNAGKHPEPERRTGTADAWLAP